MIVCVVVCVIRYQCQRRIWSGRMNGGIDDDTNGNVAETNHPLRHVAMMMLQTTSASAIGHGDVGVGCGDMYNAAILSMYVVELG